VKETLMVPLLLVTLCDAPLSFAQAKPSTTSPNEDRSLTVTTIGNGDMFGHRAAFRTYETQNHTEALVWYTTFRTEQEAKHAIKKSIREYKITGKKHIKELSGRAIGDRITGTPRGQDKAFMIIRRQGLNCWIIQSISLEVAMQVDGLIDPPLAKN
jgi:hypothetical protein